MAEFLKHKNSNVNTEIFNDIFSVADLNKYESLYLFSSIADDSKAQDRVLKKDLTNKEQMVFIASDASNYEKNDKYTAELIKYFNQFNIGEFTVIDQRVTKYAAIKLLENADVIFLLGGDPTKQIAFIKEYEMAALINKSKGIIIGMSAGAINLAKISYCSKDEDIPETLIYEGLGLIDITVDPHFDVSNKEQAEEFLKTDISLIGLPDGSFIKEDKYGSKTFYGEYYIKDKNKIARKADNA